MIENTTFAPRHTSFAETVARIKVWIHNLSVAPFGVMAGILRHRGYVVFYLDPQSRTCNGVCWMKAYETSEHYRKNAL